MKLEKELKDETYKARTPHIFVVTAPKVRRIVSISFRDRVYQRALNDHILFPIMSKSFIYDNFACQPYKGTDAARNRLKDFLHRAYRKNGADLWVLQIDIRKYYDTMNHDLVEDMFRRKLPDDAYNATVDVLRSQYPGDIGYSPGSQMVQIAGVSFLDDLDHFIKERLRVKHYLRYMDDAVIVHHDKAFLEQCKESIANFLLTKKLEAHPKKTRIYQVSEGIPFLGFNFNLTNTGKVLMFVKTDCVRREKRKLKKLVRRCESGLMSRDDVDRCFQSWLAHIRKGNSYNLEKRMTLYYKQLWR